MLCLQAGRRREEAQKISELAHVVGFSTSCPHLLAVHRYGLRGVLSNQHWWLILVVVGLLVQFHSQVVAVLKSLGLLLLQNLPVLLNLELTHCPQLLLLVADQLGPLLLLHLLALALLKGFLFGLGVLFHLRKQGLLMRALKLLLGQTLLLRNLLGHFFPALLLGLLVLKLLLALLLLHTTHLLLVVRVDLVLAVQNGLLVLQKPLMVCEERVVKLTASWGGSPDARLRN